MNNLARNFWLTVVLSLLAAPLLATQPTTPASTNRKAAAVKPATHSTKKTQSKHTAAKVQKGKRSTGEASRLEQHEAGMTEDASREDNHGRVTAHHVAARRHAPTAVAKKAHPTQPHAALVNAHAKSAGSHAASQKPATLKTGQLTSQKSAHIQTKSASFHPAPPAPDAKKPVIKEKASEKDKAPAQPAQGLPTTQLRLKDHNARMF